ncbi:TetR/AcrR family transcriptional regulator [Methylosinus sp. PW1]|uniref:TetR/AcrR family transcriptional regulator n=1 Tax=Methylosinus sp. PW1 TaxID=107636 RepID=UPI00055F80A9|nr:TetR/AcrR family transcriptional regulator [Methylosinus sp. PW1]
MTIKRKYHHGALKEALVEAALELLAEGGPANLSLGEAAKRVGVTAAAPYRHFASREDLLNEVARRGFLSFGSALEKAWDEGRPEAAAAMWRMCAAYLAFAREEPGLYAAMFGSAATLASEPSADAADHALDILWRSVVAFLQQRGVAAQGARKLALQLWALAHGVAMLTISGHLDAAKGLDPIPVLDAAARNLMESAARRAETSSV